MHSHCLQSWSAADKNVKEAAADEDSGDDDSVVQTAQRLMADANQSLVAGKYTCTDDAGRGI